MVITVQQIVVVCVLFLACEKRELQETAKKLISKDGKQAQET
jgi:hypothetical protein